MKSEYTLPLFILIGLIVSCDSTSPEDVVLLRTDSFSGSIADHVESWVYISNRNGQLLDLRKISEEEGVIEFEGVADDWVIVTEVSVASFDINGVTRLQHQVTSYFGVPVGSTYLVAESEPNQTTYPDTLGRASLQLNNYYESNEPLFTIGFSDSYNSFNNWLDRANAVYDGSTLKADMILRESPIDIFISAYDGPEPVYKWLRNVEVGDDIVIDFEQFLPQKKVPINKPVTNAYIQGQIEPQLGGRGYELSRSEYRSMSDTYAPSEIIELGYVDGFEYYDTYAQAGPIYCCQPHEGVTYHKLGSSVPESINLPDYEFVLNNGNLFELNYSFDRSFSQVNYYFADQGMNSTFNWFIRVPDGIDLVVPAIPLEITAKYPFLDRDELSLSFVRFTEYLDGYSYQRFIRSRLERRPGRENFEVLEYYFQF